MPHPDQVLKDTVAKVHLSNQAVLNNIVDDLHRRAYQPFQETLDAIAKLSLPSQEMLDNLNRLASEPYQAVITSMSEISLPKLEVPNQIANINRIVDAPRLYGSVNNQDSEEPAREK